LDTGDEIDMTNFSEIASTVQHLQSLAPEAFMPIENDIDLERATAFLKALDAEKGETPGHPLAPLADRLMERIMAYEAVHFPVPDADGPVMLAFYLQQRGLTQQQLAAATGISQGLISLLLRRQRAFTAHHARTFGAFFQVNPGIFL
jgi:HTH-type transcriptional regulator/antitoxin HigA